VEVVILFLLAASLPSTWASLLRALTLALVFRRLQELQAPWKCQSARNLSICYLLVRSRFGRDVGMTTKQFDV
jgi:hypothetical protein